MEFFAWNNLMRDSANQYKEYINMITRFDNEIKWIQ